MLPHTAGVWAKKLHLNTLQTLHFTPPAVPTDQTAECFQLEAPFNSAVIKTATQSHSCPPQKHYIMTPLCAEREGLCTFYISQILILPNSVSVCKICVFRDLCQLLLERCDFPLGIDRSINK